MPIERRPNTVLMKMRSWNSPFSYIMCKFQLSSFGWHECDINCELISSTQLIFLNSNCLQRVHFVQHLWSARQVAGKTWIECFGYKVSNHGFPKVIYLLWFSSIGSQTSTVYICMCYCYHNHRFAILLLQLVCWYDSTNIIMLFMLLGQGILCFNAACLQTFINFHNSECFITIW